MIEILGPETKSATLPVPGGDAAQPDPPSRIVTGRKLWLTVHKYIGLVLGTLFVFVGLTGSILAFWQTIDEWLNQDIMIVAVPPGGATGRPLDEILAAAKAAAPPDTVPGSLRMPRHASAAAMVYVVPADAVDPDFYEIFVDPYTAKVTGQRLGKRGDSLLSQPFINIIMDLHWTLLLGYDKAYLVGIPAIFLMVSVLAGLYLWWPRNGNWRQALTIKRGASFERLTLDIHKTIGLYLSAVLIVILFSGIYMIFKPQVRAIVQVVSPVREEPVNAKSKPIPGRPPLGLDAAAAIADKIFPDGKLHEIGLPTGPEGVYSVGKRANSEPNRASTNRNVTIDQ